MRRPCQDVERTIPSRLLHRQALPVACVSHIEGSPCEAPIMRRPVSTAKTTVLLVYELTAKMTCTIGRY